MRIGEGISAGRGAQANATTAVGHGQAKPIADSLTEAGCSANRGTIIE
ncbi:hypothetical protein X738_09375 [Mesorhizobium sp. LNHC209A00]|jgi:hypothetical protein|nr:hypothetical protein X738_09375 [Mesorhizobium sp. LNHC209A00]